MGCPESFFSTEPTPTEIYTLSLHDALPICFSAGNGPTRVIDITKSRPGTCRPGRCAVDRKSTRLNSSHRTISYAVFCLKKKNDHPRSPPEIERSRQTSKTDAPYRAHGTADA